MAFLLPPRPRKAAELIQFLEGKIVSGQFPAGHRLPPLRQLQADFHLSYSTVQRGIASLCSRGLLEKSGRDILIGRESGGRTRKTIRQIAVYLLSYRLSQRAGLYLSVLQGIQQSALEKGYSVLVDPLEPESDHVARIQESATRASGIVLLLEYDSFISEYPLLQPTVGVQMVQDFGGRISLVDVDPLNAAEQATAFFRQRGVKKMRVFATQLPSYEIRAEIFMRRWRQETGVMPELFLHGRGEMHYEVEFAPDTGHFFTSDNLLQVYCDYYAGRFPGRTLPADACVLGVDGKRLLMSDFATFPTIAVDWQEIGRAAFEECFTLIEHPGRPRRRIWMPGTLRLD